MKKYVLAVVLCWTTTMVVAQDSSALPIDLVADSGFYDQLEGTAIYEGNVRVTQGVATIWADKMTIKLKENTAELITAESTGKQLVRIEYQGEQQPIKGKGKKAVYHVSSKVVDLVGDAEIEQGQDTIKGKSLTYDLTKEIIEGSRVRMIFLPSNDN